MKAQFEEVAYLLIYGQLPTEAQLKNYKSKLKSLRGLPNSVKIFTEKYSGSCTLWMLYEIYGVSYWKCSRRKDDHNVAGARDIADKLLASFSSGLLYWYHYSHNRKEIEVNTDDIISGHFLHFYYMVRNLLNPGVKAMQDFHLTCMPNTNSMLLLSQTGLLPEQDRIFIQQITGAIGALKGPKHGGANEVVLKYKAAINSPDEAEADIHNESPIKKEVIIGFGHPVLYNIDPRKYSY